MADSEDDELLGALPERRNRHKFKTLAEKLTEVDLNVYKAVGEVRDEPLPGCTSFAQEQLNKWREQSTAEAWIALSKELNDPLQSFELLVLHADAIFDALLARTTFDARLSLAPVLSIMAAFARDLQVDFVRYWPRLLAAISTLVDEAVSDADALELAFVCLATVLKHVHPHLLTALPATLRHSRRLRYHSARHVRCFAAQVFGLLLRKAPPGALQDAVEALLCEAAARGLEERIHGAGLLLAESVLGPQHALHSRAGALLRLLLRSELPAAVGVGIRDKGLTSDQVRSRVAAVAASMADRMLDHVRRGKCHVLWDVVLSELHSRLDAALSHTYPGPPAAPGMPQVAAPSPAAAAAPPQSNGRAPPTATAVEADALSDVTFALALLAQLVEYFRGSRVEDFGPVLQTAARLMQSELWTRGDGAAAPEAAELPSLVLTQVDVTPPADVFVGATFSGQVLRLLLAIIHAHGKATGASQGIRVIAAVARGHDWDPALSAAPPLELLAFSAALLQPPTDPTVPELFKARVLGAVGELVLQGSDSPSHHRLALPLLCSFCEALRPRAEPTLSAAPGARAAAAVPLLFTAHSNGAQLSARVRSLLASCTAALSSPPSSDTAADADNDAAGSSEAADAQASADRAGASATVGHVAVAALCLRLLPHACKSGEELAEACAALLSVCSGRLATVAASGGSAPGALTSRALSDACAVEDAAFLCAEAMTMLASNADEVGDEARLLDAAAQLREWLRSLGANFHVVRAAAHVMGLLRRRLDGAPSAADSSADSRRRMEALLSEDALEGLLPSLQDNLLAESQPMRAATLALLCCFQQPPETAAGSPEAKAEEERKRLIAAAQGEVVQGSKAGVARSAVLGIFRKIERTACTLESGRAGAVAVGGVANLLEYKRVPPVLLPVVARCLMGVLCVKFADLWEPAQAALAAGLKYELTSFWPVVLRQLRDVQSALLASTLATVHSRRLHGHHTRHAHAETPLEALGPDLLGLYATLRSDDGSGARGCTDASTRLGCILKAMAKAPSNHIERVCRDWVGLAISFISAKADGVDSAAADVDDDEDDDGATAGADTVGAGVAATPKPGAKRRRGEAADGGDDDGERRRSGKRASTSERSSRASLPDNGAAATEPGWAGGDDRVPAPLRRVRAGGKDWRERLKDWLTLISKLNAARNLHRGAELQALVVSQLLDIDADVQRLVLQCLSTYKVRAVAPYMEQLLGYCDNKTLKGTLARFPLQRGAENGIAEADRATALAVIIRVLFPKLRKRSGRLGGRGAPGSARAAILNKLAALEAPELTPLLELFLQPLERAFRQPPEQLQASKSGGGASHDAPLGLQPRWWAEHMATGDVRLWLALVDEAALAAEPLRRRQGLLNTIVDHFGHLGYRMQPFLPVLSVLASLLLKDACRALELPAGDPAAEGAKGLRSQCLRVLAAMLARFPAECDWAPLWPTLLPAVQPLAARLPGEAASAAAPPALLQLVLALASSPHLALVLADRASALELPEGLAGADDDEAAPSTEDRPPVQAVLDSLPPADDEWARAGLGSALVRSCARALATGATSAAARDSCLSAVEALLRLGPVVTHLALLPHIDELLQALQTVLSSASAEAGRGGRRPRGNAREMAILEALGPHVRRAESAERLSEVLMTMVVGGRRMNESHMIRALCALAVLWTRLAALLSPLSRAALNALPPHASSPSLDAGWAQQLLAAARRLAPLASRLTHRDARAALADAYAALAALLPELSDAAAVVAATAAFSETSLNDVDFAARLDAYAGLTVAKWRAMPEASVLPAMHAAVFDAKNPADLATRSAAAMALTRLVEAAAQTANRGGGNGVAQGDGAPPDASPSSLAAIVPHALLHAILPNLTAAAPTVRQEFLALLRACVTSFPERFPDLLPLTHVDPEADFFFNVAHVQLHRRTRALNKLAAAARLGSGGGGLSVGTLLSVAVPLLQTLVLDGEKTEAARGGHGEKHGEADRVASVVDAAVTALGAVAAQLPWPQYLQLLNRFLRVCKTAGERGGAVGGRGAAAGGAQALKNGVRAACAVIDAFHFVEPGARLDAAGIPRPASDVIEAEIAAREAGVAPELVASAPPADAVPAAADGAAEDAGAEGEDDGERAEGDEEEGEDGVVAEAAAAEDAAGRDALHASMQRTLVKSVLPVFLRLLTKDKEHVRPAVALAAVKLIRVLPRDTERWQLPKVLQTVSNLLANRAQGVRDDARDVLVKLVRALGPSYMPFVCDTLALALPAKGFTAHVLGFTLNACLAELVAVGTSPGELDDAIEQMLPLMESELFGDVAEAKDEAAFANKYREARAMRAYDTYQRLASLVTFSTHIDVLLIPVQDRLALAAAPRVRNKLTQLLQYAARGVLANASATPEAVLLFVYGRLKAGLAREKAERAAIDGEAGLAQRPSDGAAVDEEEAQRRSASRNEMLLDEFALLLLSQRLKKCAAELNGADMLGRLDPLLPMLVECLRSRNSGTVTLALKNLNSLVHLPLPSLQQSGPDLGKNITQLLKKAPRTSHPIAQDCFKLLAGLLRESPAFRPPVSQLRFLMGWAFADLSDTGSRQTLFSLLKAILSRRVREVAEVYDVMKRVQELLVQSQSESCRAMCASALLQFLLDWPLEERRLRQHLDFLVANLEYEYEDGRLQVLEFLQNVIAKFPAAVVDGRAMLFFLPLVARLVNDGSAACRAAAAATIKALLRRVAAKSVNEAVAACRDWLSADDPRLRRAAAQVLGQVADAEGAALERRLPGLLPPVLALLAPHLSLTSDVEVAVGDEDAPVAAPGWQEAYHALAFLEKAAVAAPGALRWAPGGAVEGPRAAWLAAVDLLRHRHLWVRKAAGRLVGAALARPDVADGLLAEPLMPARLAFNFFCHLEGQAADEALLTQAVKCLVSVARALHAAEVAQHGGLLELGKFERRAAAGGAVDVDAQGDDDDDDDEAGGGADDSDGDDGGDGGGDARAKALTLRGLFLRLSKLAGDRRTAQAAQREAALRWIAAASTHLGPDVMLTHDGALLRLCMTPLFRVLDAEGLDPPEVKTLADEVASHLRSVVSADTVAAFYNDARSAAAARRRERVRRVALQAVVDPEAAARRKIRRNERRGEDRKRKMAEVKRLRQAGVRVHNKAGGEGRAKKRSRDA